MRHTLLLILTCVIANTSQAQHTFRGATLSEALITLDQSSNHYDISFVYDELEDFTVSKTIKKGRSLPDAVREVCGFYPVRVIVQGRDIFVECIQKDRTKLSGRLVDSDLHPVAYANLTLFHPFDSTYIGGGVSNETGDFVIPCGIKQAKVRISCVGFKTIERIMTISHVGTINMQMENHFLPGITVSGNVPIIRNQTDRLQYIVAHDPFAKGLNVMELLSRVPMVSINGNHATILGKGEASFMLNGRQMLADKETIRQKLWSIRAEDIDRIEVISIPSGRYQTDVSGGYINIVLNRDQTLGWRSDLNGQITNSDDWSERMSASVSYAASTFDVTTEVIIERKTEARDVRTVYHDKTDLVRSDFLQRESATNDIGANTILHYMPNKKIELGTMLSFHQQRQSNNHTNLVNDYDNLKYSYDEKDFACYYEKGLDFTYYFKGGQSPIKPTRTYNLTAYCDWQMDDTGKKLSLTYNYYRKRMIDKTFVESVDSLSDWKRVDIISGADVKFDIHSAKLDFDLPFNDLNMKAGIAYTDINTDAGDHNFRNSEFRRPYNLYKYDERTASAYLNIEKNLSKTLFFHAGLLCEHTWLKGETGLMLTRTNSVTMDKDYQAYQDNDYNESYSHLLPTIRLNYQLSPTQQLSLNWGMGIHRPNLNDLNPLRVYQTKVDYSEGSPALKPSKTNNLEISYHNKHGLHLTAYHHYHRHQTEWLSSLYMDTSKSIDNQLVTCHYQRTTPQNAVSYDRTGVNIHYQKPFGWYDIIFEGDAYYYHSTTTGIETSDYRDISPFDAATEKAPHGWGSQFSINANCFLNRSHSLVFNTQYLQVLKQFTGTAEYNNYGYFCFALRYSLLHDRLKLSLCSTDPFKQYVTDIIHRYGSYKVINHTNMHAQSFTLLATYSLGGTKVRHNNRNTSNTDLQRTNKNN